MEKEDARYQTLEQLHDQRHRIREHESAQDYQESGIIPERRGVAEIVLPGTDEHQPEMDDATAKLESRAQPVYHHVRGADASPLT